LVSLHSTALHCTALHCTALKVGEGWVPTAELPAIREALARGAATAGSASQPTLERISTAEEHPTFHRTNKYTAGYQALVDSYGVNTYREVNPAVYTIATFPFLFAVMFGDAGHGTIMLIFALWMIISEKKLVKYVDSSEIFKIFFGGRYIILMMSVGAIYTGLIYNDIFSKSINIFGSHFKIPMNFTASPDKPLVLENTIGLDPKMLDQYTDTPYPFGVDPVWLTGDSHMS
jgi:V-type H+-transporting ATPase subunit a